jgi:hypothetical protein
MPHTPHRSVAELLARYPFSVITGLGLSIAGSPTAIMSALASARQRQVNAVHGS